MDILVSVGSILFLFLFFPITSLCPDSVFYRYMLVPVGKGGVGEF